MQQQMVLKQKIEILIVGLKFTQDSELCFMVRRQVKLGEEEGMSIWFGDVSSDVSGEVSGDYRPPHRDGHSSLRSSGAPCPRSFLVTIAMPANRHIHSQNVSQGLPCMVDI